MKVFFFDIDDTTVTQLYEGGQVQPLPGAVDCIKGLLELGYEVYFWSNRGKEWAEFVAAEIGIQPTGCCSKPHIIMDDKPEKLVERLTRSVILPSWQELGQRFLRWRKP